MSSTNRSAGSGRFWIAAAVWTVLLHYVWEMGQSRFFADMANMPLLRHALVCFVASLADLAIAVAAYAATVVLLRRQWPLRRGWWWPAALWMTISMAFGVAIERWALASGRWTYTASMPTLWGVGLLPLIQWIIVPAATLLVLQIKPSRRGGG